MHFHLLLVREIQPLLTRIHFGLLHVLVSLTHSAASYKICIRMTVSTCAHMQKLTNTHTCRVVLAARGSEGGVLCQVKVRFNRARVCATTTLIVCMVFICIHMCLHVVLNCCTRVCVSTGISKYTRCHGRSSLTVGEGKGRGVPLRESITALTVKQS